MSRRDDEYEPVTDPSASVPVPDTDPGLEPPTELAVPAFPEPAPEAGVVDTDPSLSFPLVDGPPTDPQAPAYLPEAEVGEDRAAAPARPSPETPRRAAPRRQGAGAAGARRGGPRDASGRRRRLRMPWEMLFVVVVYLALATGVWYWAAFESEPARIARALAAGEAVMGEDQGHSATTPALLEAAEHYLEALTLDPNLQTAHARLESIKWRLEERGERIPLELQRRHAALAARSRYGNPRTATLPMSADERFGLSTKAEFVGRVMRWLGVGFVAVLVLALLRAVRFRPEEPPPPSVDDRGSAAY
ncbi:MAG: hypothetical protein D6729_16715 [Deltaproteobacteria bacterium]|nr:MAG: hypothetical protein D6729_16715 [Deltaproteobacteria bacterium]